MFERVWNIPVPGSRRGELGVGRVVKNEDVYLFYREGKLLLFKKYIIYYYM